MGQAQTVEQEILSSPITCFVCGEDGTVGDKDDDNNDVICILFGRIIHNSCYKTNPKGIYDNGKSTETTRRD